MTTINHSSKGTIKMATTYALTSPAPSSFASTIKVLSAAQLANLLVGDPKIEGNVRSCQYVYNYGPAADRFFIATRREYNPKQNMTYCEVKVDTFVRKTVSETGLVTEHPVGATISWKFEGVVTLGTDLMLEVLTVAFGLTSAVNAAENPSSNVINSFDRGAVNALASA